MGPVDLGLEWASRVQRRTLTADTVLAIARRFHTVASFNFGDSVKITPCDVVQVLAAHPRVAALQLGPSQASNDVLCNLAKSCSALVALTLDLRGCRRLVPLPAEVGQLAALQTLDPSH